MAQHVDTSENIIIGHCELCGSPIYGVSDGNTGMLACDCGHEGVARFIRDMGSPKEEKPHAGQETHNGPAEEAPGKGLLRTK